MTIQEVEEMIIEEGLDPKDFEIIINGNFFHIIDKNEKPNK